jgi:hypothetical protein
MSRGTESRDHRATAEASANISPGDKIPDTLTDIETLSARLRAGIEVKDRSYHLTTYKQVFLGTEAVAFMLREGIATRYLHSRVLGARLTQAQHDIRAISRFVYSEQDACDAGDLMIAQGDLYHCTKEHTFKNQALFYQFAADAPNHGKKGVVPTTGEELSWKHLSEGTYSVHTSRRYRFEISVYVIWSARL